MANLNLNVEKKQIVFGEDSVIIQKFENGIKGGRVLDTTDVTEKVFYAGRVIITDGKGTYKALPTTTSGDGETKTVSYDALPADYSYAGVLYRSILVSEPAASIMTSGQVCEPAAITANGAEYPADFKTACPKIEFIKDENAGDNTDTDAEADA